MSGRTLAIGDVHGCDTALATLLDLLAPQRWDTVVFLGDLVDRGPGTKQVLDAVLALHRVCRVVVIRGNHEELMLRALNGESESMWMERGGDAVVDSYGGDLRNIPDSHVDLLQGTVDYWETPSTIFVHANLQTGLPLAAQFPVWLRWSPLTGGEQPYAPPRRVICGHTPRQDGYPWELPGWVCIDTDCHRGGWLTCLDIDNDAVCQANEAGMTRTFPLGVRD